MSNQHKITNITDTLKLTEDQFGRFLVDFTAWWALCKAAEADGAQAVGFTWIDDSMQGQIHHVAGSDQKTGEKWIIKGPAFGASQ